MDIITYLYHPLDKGHYLRRGEREEEQGRNSKAVNRAGGWRENRVALQRARECQWVRDELKLEPMLCSLSPSVHLPWPK